MQFLPFNCNFLETLGHCSASSFSFFLSHTDLFYFLLLPLPQWRLLCWELFSPVTQSAPLNPFFVGQCVESVYYASSATIAPLDTDYRVPLVSSSSHHTEAVTAKKLHSWPADANQLSHRISVSVSVSCYLHQWPSLLPSRHYCWRPLQSYFDSEFLIQTVRSVSLTDWITTRFSRQWYADLKRCSNLMQSFLSTWHKRSSSRRTATTTSCECASFFVLLWIAHHRQHLIVFFGSARLSQLDYCLRTSLHKWCSAYATSAENGATLAVAVHCGGSVSSFTGPITFAIHCLSMPVLLQFTFVQWRCVSASDPPPLQPINATSKRVIRSSLSDDDDLNACDPTIFSSFFFTIVLPLLWAANSIYVSLLARWLFRF